MDVSCVNPFIVSTIQTFKTMINWEVKPGKPEIKKEPFPMYDVSGIIGLSGGARGAIAISFPKLVALRVVSAMVGTDLKVVGTELTDGIGELANIIAGNAKQDLVQYKLSISLPHVIIGKNHMIASQKEIPTLLVPFIASQGQFAMGVSLKS